MQYIIQPVHGPPRPPWGGEGSIVAQGGERIRAAVAGGGGGGAEGGREDEGGGGEVGEGVGGGDLEEELREEAGEGEGGGQAEGDAGGGEGEAAGEDEADDAGGGGAEGHADAELAGALGDVVGEHAVGAAGGQRQGQQSEEQEEFGGGAGGGEAGVDQSGQGTLGSGGDVGIELGDGAPEDRSRGGMAGAQRERHEGERALHGRRGQGLGIGEVELALKEIGIAAEGEFAHIGDDADHRPWREPGFERGHGFSERALARPESAGERAVDEDDFRGGGGVGIGEGTAGEQRDAQGAKVSRSDEIGPDQRDGGAGQERMIVEDDRGDGHDAAERKGVDQPGRLHAGEGGDAGLEVAVEIGAAGSGGAIGVGGGDAHRNYVLGVEAGAGAAELDHAGGEQRAGDDDHHGDGDLGHEQHGGEALAGGSRVGLGTHGGVEVDVGGAPSGNQAGGQADEQGEAEGEAGGAPMQCGGGEVGGVGGQDADQQRHAPGGEQEAERAAEQREAEGFADELPNDPGAAGAQRHADGQLAAPRGDADQ